MIEILISLSILSIEHLFGSKASTFALFAACFLCKILNSKIIFKEIYSMWVIIYTIDIIIKVFYLEDFSIMILLSRFCVEFLLKIAMMLVFQNGIWLSHYVPLISEI